MFEFPAKRRNCGSRFLVTDTHCIWYSNRWKCSLFEHMFDGEELVEEKKEKEDVDKKVGTNLTVPIHCKKKQNGNAQSVNCLSPKAWHLEVPEETDCSGITSITIRSKRRDRQEKERRKSLKQTRSPGKEKILTGPILRLEKEEVEVEKRSIVCKERKRELCPRLFLKKILPSGYAWGYASGKFFAMLQANFKKYLPSGYAWGYASGKFFAMPQAMLQANLKKYLPSGYAPGYASGKISENFRDFQKNSCRLRPRLRFRQFLKNIYPQAMLGATPPAKFFQK
ncbi:hypothetical protein T12_6675 [Trichinella patagoniensis]|uniref:Uncharacterized protein n=1 Tax=Trichinella patagoniensis TaxID=990121 RepID=A0A0V0ZNC1_9BILA|nr:hypothetical protein T12_6675 [Trichinella patagoniensis]